MSSAAVKVRPARAAASTPSSRDWARSIPDSAASAGCARAGATTAGGAGVEAARASRIAAKRTGRRGAVAAAPGAGAATPTGTRGIGALLVDVRDRGLRAVVLHLHHVRERGELAALPLHVLLQLEVLQVERARLLLERARRLEHVSLRRRAGGGSAVARRDRRGGARPVHDGGPDRRRQHRP